MSDSVVTGVPPLKDLNQLSFGYSLTPSKMEVRISVNGVETKLIDTVWDNDSLIIADHLRGDIVKLFQDERSLRIDAELALMRANEALCTIADEDEEDAVKEEYWLEQSHKHCAKVLVNDTKRARAARHLIKEIVDRI